MITEAEEKEEIEIEGMELEQQDESEGSSGHQAWTKQVTVRGIIVSILIGVIYSIISMKLNVTTGMIPNFNVSSALLVYVFVQTWTKVLQKAGFVVRPFTRQENTLIQTCAVACYSIAIGGGLSSYLLGLDRNTYELSGGLKTEGNSASGLKEPEFVWMTGYLFLVCFVGLFVLIPLRKILIVDMKLTYPSGMATAVLINGIHSRGDKMAKKQVHGFMKYFSISFLWAFFQWFFTGKDGSCGFSHFPTFGMKAWKHTFFFDFSTTLVGSGMIVSYLVNLSLLLGAVVSYGIMWPLIRQLKGEMVSSFFR
ncbi:hypothetical protein OIU76_017635 [Salix suchowensis]|nr:hypothetical protein OIU76_017635 [Salix suchowensis]